MKIKLPLAFVVLFFLASACKKTSNLPEPGTSGIDGIAVSDSFDWSTTNEISFSVGTSDSRFQNLIHTIYIYDQDPLQGGKILAKGAATLIRPFNTKIAFARATKEVYIVKSAPNGVKIGQSVKLDARNISISFNTTGIVRTSSRDIQTGPKFMSASGAPASTAVLPACGRSTESNNISLEKNEVVCFSSSRDVTLNVTANQGGTLKISAPNRTVTLGTFNHTDLNIVIEANTKVVFSNAELKNKETWTNYGTVKLTTKLDIRGTLDNNGTAEFTTLQVNSGGVINNYCKLTAVDLIADNIINNYSYMLTTTVKVNSNGKVNLIGGAGAGAYFEAAELHKGSNKIGFFGSNATALVKITRSIDGNLLRESGQTTNSQIMGGNLQLCTSVTGIPDGFFSSPAALGCDAYIAQGDCMPVSNGNSGNEKDSDGDGVIDKDDDYKDDKTKAYNTYSVNYDAGGSTLAFEDNWPTKGDYDLNDVVISYRYMVVTNADNKVVELSAKYQLIATGADYINGAGIQLPLAAGKAALKKAPEGVYLEDRQDSVVLILFNNSRKLQATGNTVIGNPVSPKVDFDIVLTITDGPEIKNFGAVAYNPFIWNATNGFGRGYETHLFGKNPTSLADRSLFDTKDDRSNSNGKYYSTKERLPWVIEVPVADFGYPAEGKRIDQAYKNFADWAGSSGNSNLEWYKILAGGANSDYIYTAK